MRTDKHSRPINLAKIYVGEEWLADLKKDRDRYETALWWIASADSMPDTQPLIDAAREALVEPL